MLQSPPPGISCWAVGEALDQLEAQIIGVKDTPFEGGVFKLTITIPKRYPFEPPRVHFKTKIYHPNIDVAGRICLDLLKMPPTGSWKPALNLRTVLTSIQLLMTEPNPDDPLMTDIATEFKTNKTQFTATAKQWTKLHAVQSTCTKGGLKDATNAAAATKPGSGGAVKRAAASTGQSAAQRPRT